MSVGFRLTYCPDFTGHRGSIMEILGRIFAGIGAAGILGALSFVSLLIGVLVTGMIVLMAGKRIDDYLRKRGRETWDPGSVR